MEKYEEPKFIINKNDLLGRGQFTNVYSAYKDNNKSIKYAAKLIPQLISQDESILEQFSNEILITSQFKNKNLLSFISIEEDDEGCNYIIMEYCNGKDLASFIQKLDEKKNRNSLNEEEIQKILKDILYGLSCLHRN
jgi:NIMA (never in mitosis gene a)-related kinase